MYVLSTHFWLLCFQKFSSKSQYLDSGFTFLLMKMSSEHLSSVQDNPFVRQFGLPLHARHEDDETDPSVPSSASSERGDDDDGVQEYHVNSGFVNKLRSKFAQLENKSSRVTLSRKSASVENLLSSGQSSSDNYGVKTRKGSAGRSYVDDTPVSNKVNLRHFTPAGYQPKIRPRSNELEKSSERPPIGKRETEKLKQNNVIRSVKPPLPRKTALDTNRKYTRNSSSEIISKHEHHDWKVAPDVEKVGRADIVIIDSKHDDDTKTETRWAEVNEKSAVRSTRESSSGPEEKFGTVKSAAEKERVSDENELPKPNTVSAFRTLFEKPNRGLDTLNVWRSSLSPTRRSSGSDTNSPQILSPVSTPRSPLVKVTSDNVFENSDKSQETEIIKPVAPVDNDVKATAPVSAGFVDTSTNVDTSSSSMQKSLEMFQQAAEERASSVERNENNYTDKAKQPVGSAQTSSVQHTLTPMHPVSKVFDSKSLKKSDKVKRTKPTVLTRREIIPRDTIELKHEADKRRISESEDVSNSTNSTPDISEETETGVSYEGNVKPSIKKEKDNVSPRQTKVFDSSRMVKKNREPPKVPLSPVESQQTVQMPEKVPNTVTVDITSESSTAKDVQEEMEISPIKPARRVFKSNEAGITEIKTNIVRNETNKESKPPVFKVSEQMFPKPDLEPKPEPVKMAKPADNKGAVSGMSSFLANRLKKAQPDQENQLKTSANHLTNGSSPSPVPRKRQAPGRPEVNGSIEVQEEKPALPKTPEPALMPVKTKKSQPSTAKGKMVFDSSKIASKRKEPPKRKPPRKTLDELNQNITFDSVDNTVNVPKLDLSSITNDKPETEYQEGYIPTVIKPCPFLFVGSEITFQKSPYKKTRRVQVRIFLLETYYYNIPIT